MFRLAFIHRADSMLNAIMSLSYLSEPMSRKSRAFMFTILIVKGCEPSEEVQHISLIMIDNKETVYMFSVYYTMGKTFDRTDNELCNVTDMQP